MKIGPSPRLRNQQLGALRNGAAFSPSIRSQDEIEEAVCEVISRFEHDYMGRAPLHIRAYLIGDIVVVRQQGVLTEAEQHIVKYLPPERSGAMLKLVRAQFIETARPTLDSKIQIAVGASVLSLHHDISTKTGEKVILFTLAESPLPWRSGGQ